MNYLSPVFSCKYIINPVITARKRSLGQGNIFAPVCHSVHRGEYLGRCTPQTRYTHPPAPGTPPGTRCTLGPGTPSNQVPPRTKWPPRTTGTRYTPPRTRYTPKDQVHPPLGPGTHSPRTRYTPRTRYPSARPGKYGQQAGGTHPTGMHFCF